MSILSPSPPPETSPEQLPGVIVPIAVADWFESPPLHFSLRGMFVAMTVFAVLLSLMRLAGVAGMAVTFLIAAIISFRYLPRKIAPAALVKVNVAMWGVVMPLLCLAFDPFVFKYDMYAFQGLLAGNAPSRIHLTLYAFPAYLAIGWQIGWLLLALSRNDTPAALIAFMEGVFTAGMVIAMVIGIILAPAAFFGLIALGLSVAGFTPLLTARCFNDVVMAYHRRSAFAGSHRNRKLILKLTGFALSIAMPWVFGLLLNGIIAETAPAIFQGPSLFDEMFGD